VRHLLGALLIVIGVAAIGFSLALRSQLLTITTQGEQPNPGDYPLVEFVLTKFPPARTDGPAVIAGRLGNCVHVGLAFGLSFIVAGTIILLLVRRRAVTNGNVSHDSTRQHGERCSPAKRH